MRVRLTLKTGSNAGLQTQLKTGVYLVGRSKKCQIRPKNRFVSRKHCAIIKHNKMLMIRDLGSKYGTFVNDVRVDDEANHRLRDGDKIRLGKVIFEVRIQKSKRPKKAKKKDIREQVSESLRPSPELDEAALAMLMSQSGDQVPLNGHSVSPHSLDESDQVERAAKAAVDDEQSRTTPQSSFESLPTDSSQTIELPSVIREFAGGESTVPAVVPASENSESASATASVASALNGPVDNRAMRQDWDVRSVYSWLHRKRVDEQIQSARKRARPPKGFKSLQEVSGKSDSTETDGKPKIKTFADRMEWLSSGLTERWTPVLMVLGFFLAIGLLSWTIYANFIYVPDMHMVDLD